MFIQLSSGSLHGYDESEPSSDGADTPDPPVRGTSRRGRPSRRRGSVRGRGRGGRGRGRGRGTSTSQGSLSAVEGRSQYIQVLNLLYIHIC